MATALGRWALLHVRPPGDRAGDERGSCSVCGAETRFVLNSWVLPAGEAGMLGDPRLVRAFRRRESLWCSGCLASLRVRRLAAVLVEHYGQGARSLAELVDEPGFGALEVAEINAIGAAHAVLVRHPRLRATEYPQEDLLALSYVDASFDLVLTSDTLEHVPDADRALREIRRVLRPGGRHVFTVPASPHDATVIRAGFVDGGVVHAEPPAFHGRGAGPFRLVTRRSDMLAFADFGTDLVERVDAAGFRTEVHFAADPDLAIVYCSSR